MSTTQPLYTAEVASTGGRQDGLVRSTDGNVALKVSLPGSDAEGTNPEELFAAGYAACFESALRLTARLQKKTISDVSITARVTIGQAEDRGFRLGVELQGHLPGMSQEEADTLMHAAHQVCPYSHATRGNIDVKLSASTEAKSA
jgi:Ohr subfamily peroxiredoxin